MAGFTLVELIVTILIAGILAAAAIPSFSGMLANQRAKSVATDLVVAMTRARNEAIMRNADVTLAPNAGGWKNGWTIYPSLSPGTILESHGASPATVVINASFTGTGSSVIYQSSGRLNSTLTGTASFAISTTGADTVYRCVTTDLSGRTLTKSTSTCP